MKIVTATIKIRIKTDPSDPVQLEADLAEALQGYIDEEGLVDIVDFEEEDEEEEEDA